MADNHSLLTRIGLAVAPGWMASRAESRMRAEYMMSYSKALGLSRTSRTPSGQENQLGSQRALTGARLDKMRRLSRDLETDSVHAAGILKRAVDNMVGCGFSLQCKTDDDGWNKRAEEYYARWAQAPDVIGMFPEFKIDRIILNSHLRDGDVGEVLLSNGKIQIVEGHQVKDPVGRRPKGAIIHDGVEMTRTGRPVAYWVEEVGADDKKTYTRVPATYMTWFHRTKRPNQPRGEPCFTPLFKLFDHSDGYVEASVVSARMAASISGVVTSGNANIRFSRNTTQDSDGNTANAFHVEPGTIPRLMPGETFTPYKAEQPTQYFDPFLTTLMRISGLEMGMPLELVMLNFSQTNYSSARAALQQFYRSAQCVQWEMIERVKARRFRWVIGRAMRSGELPFREDAFNHEWLPEPWDYLDPVAEAQGKQLMIDMGLTTLTRELRPQSVTLEERIAERSREIKLMREADVPLMRGTLALPIAEAQADEALGQSSEPARTNMENDDTEGADDGR